jgi:DNA-3-methyladenine glycosylase
MDTVHLPSKEGPLSGGGLPSKNALTGAFFQQPAELLAPALLGKYLVFEDLWGKIVETEAYLSHDDPGSHAYRGLTKRNAPMFGPAGYSYVYFIYGMYHCFNIVSGKTGEGEAVLIRALEPARGIEVMQENRRATGELLSYGERRTKTVENLCNGPGKLTQAFGITKKHNDISLVDGPIRLYDSGEIPVIGISTRIGLTNGADLPLRFFCEGSRFVSR